MNAERSRRRATLGAVAALVFAAVLLLIPCTIQGAGFAFNENFIVLAPDQPLAEQVLARADYFRRQIAEEWFDEQLAPRVGRTAIHVELSPTEDSGLTWVKDRNDPQQTLHMVWITTTRERALGSLLGHEMTHVLFATKFPERLPRWIEEGIACRKDDAKRVTSRRRIIGRYAQSGDWPRLEHVVQAPRIRARDDTAYSVAPSVVEYLLSLGDKAALLRFAAAAKLRGCDQALRECYGLRSVGDLQLAWQQWARQATRPYVHLPAHRSVPLAAAAHRP